MLNVRLDLNVWDFAVAGDVFDGAFLCCPFPHEMPWMRSGIKLSHAVQPTLP